jgi:hypothetical protein
VRQQLADIAAGQRGPDRLELAPDFHRSIRLQVANFKLAGRAVQVQEDARFGLAEVAVRRPRVSRLGGMKPVVIAEPDTEKSQAAGPEEIAARPAITELLARSQDAQHQHRPPGSTRTEV